MFVLLRTSVVLSLLVFLLFPNVVAGQEHAAVDGLGTWVPIGPVPVDQAGAGLRGYVIAGEGTDVAAAGGSEIFLHAVAANNFYREQTERFSISQRYETHTLAFGYRRGFRAGRIPRLELGGQLQLTESDRGFMNGFISGTEDVLAKLTGQQSARNPFRQDGLQPPLGTQVIDAGRILYQAGGSGSGLGDLSFVAKALVRDGAPSSSRTRVAVRVDVNVSGTSEFTEGDFAGVGVSVDRKVLRWAALHGDLRSTFLFDRASAWHLPLKRGSLAFSAGPELRLSASNSGSIQIDGSTTPYLSTATTALDRGYGDIVLGFSHRSVAGQRQIITAAYLRENMNLPFRVRWNTDPDLALGIKITIHSNPR